MTCVSLPALAQPIPSTPAPLSLANALPAGPQVSGDDPRPEIGFRGCVDSKCSADWETERIRRELAAIMAAKLEEQLRGGLPADCTSAICFREKLEELPSFSNTPSLAVIKCKDAICTTIEDPIVPNWRLWEIIANGGGNPFKNCKDAMCIAPQGRVAGPDAESDADLKRLQKAEERARAKKEAAQQAAAVAEAAKEEEDKKRREQQAADDAAKNARAEQAAASQQALRDARSLKAQEIADRAYAERQEAKQAEIKRREQARIDQRAANQLKWDAAENRLIQAEARADAALEAREEASARTAERADDARRASESARMAAQAFMAELGAYPYLSNYMMVCRGAGTSCIEPTGIQGGNAPDPNP